jgi:hypothetical protein
VTGAAQGIGRATAEHLLAGGVAAGGSARSATACRCTRGGRRGDRVPPLRPRLVPEWRGDSGRRQRDGALLRIPTARRHRSGVTTRTNRRDMAARAERGHKQPKVGADRVFLVLSELAADPDCATLQELAGAWGVRSRACHRRLTCAGSPAPPPTSILTISRATRIHYLRLEACGRRRRPRHRQRSWSRSLRLWPRRPITQTRFQNVLPGISTSRPQRTSQRPTADTRCLENFHPRLGVPDGIIRTVDLSDRPGPEGLIRLSPCRLAFAASEITVLTTGSATVRAQRGCKRLYGPRAC